MFPTDRLGRFCQKNRPFGLQAVQSIGRECALFLLGQVTIPPLGQKYQTSPNYRRLKNRWATVFLTLEFFVIYAPIIDHIKKMNPFFPLGRHYRKSILNWLLSTLICSSTLAPAEPLTQIIVNPQMACALPFFFTLSFTLFFVCVCVFWWQSLKQTSRQCYGFYRPPLY